MINQHCTKSDQSFSHSQANLIDTHRQGVILQPKKYPDPIRNRQAHVICFLPDEPMQYMPSETNQTQSACKTEILEATLQT